MDLLQQKLDVLMLSGEGKGQAIPGGLIHPYIDIEVSLLMKTNLESYATLLQHTTAWLEWEAIPFCLLHIKYIVRNLGDLPVNPLFD